MVLLRHRKAWMGKLHRFNYSTPSKDPRLTRSKQSPPNQQWPEDVLEKAGFDRQIVQKHATLIQDLYYIGKKHSEV